MGQFSATLDLDFGDSMEGFNTKFDNENSAIVFFHLETAGFRKTDDILQIICKCNDSIFNEYVHPTQPISDLATKANGLRNIKGKLHFRHIPLKTHSLERVLSRLLRFLKEFEKPCILVAHSLRFHYPRLIRAIQIYDLDEEFSSVIRGFVDTLPLFKKNVPQRTGTEMFQLKTLASKYLPNFSLFKFQNGKYKIYSLEKLALRYISLEDLLQSSKTYSHFSQKVANNTLLQSQEMNLDDSRNIPNDVRLCIEEMRSEMWHF